jgi:DNA-directed RNA polymerase subunit RPC12/RpoP
MMTKLLLKEEVKIRCPHCKQEISNAWICKMDSIIGMRYAYLCSNCQKLMGITSVKNFLSVKYDKGGSNILNLAF